MWKETKGGGRVKEMDFFFEFKTQSFDSALLSDKSRKQKEQEKQKGMIIFSQ